MLCKVPLFSCGTFPQLRGRGIWLLSFLSNLDDFAVNTIRKDKVLPRANALIVSSGTVCAALLWDDQSCICLKSFF